MYGMSMHNNSLNWTAGRAASYVLATSVATSYFSCCPSLHIGSRRGLPAA